MSSNIEIKKLCVECSGLFIAKTTLTKYCSKKCTKKAWRKNKKESVIIEINKQTQKELDKPKESLKFKEYLTVQDTSLLLNLSLRTTYRLINNGTIQSVKISPRKTLIRKSDIDKLFQDSYNVEAKKEEIVTYPLHECYTISEAQTKFNISDTGLNNIIKRNKIQKYKVGWFTYIPKVEIEKVMGYGN